MAQHYGFLVAGVAATVIAVAVAYNIGDYMDSEDSQRSDSALSLPWTDGRDEPPTLEASLGRGLKQGATAVVAIPAVLIGGIVLWFLLSDKNGNSPRGDL